MSTIAELAGVIVWLMLGGWACRRMGPGTPDSLLGGLVVACLLLAPFAAGVAVAELTFKRRAQDHRSGEE